MLAYLMQVIKPGDVLSALPWRPLLLLVLVGVVVIVLKALLKRGRSPEVAGVTYTPRPFLTRAELLFLETLDKVASPRSRVFAQVPLCALVDVKANNYSATTSARNRIDRKSVDFVLVDSVTMAVQKVVELDDRSHDHKQERDALVDAALGQAGIPIVHCPAQSRYDSSVLREKLGLNY